MRAANSLPVTENAKSPINGSDFRIVGTTLLIPSLMTHNLDAYRWNAPNGDPVFFVFTNNDVHIITLDEGEEAFSRVKSHNEEREVTEITNEEIREYADEAERYLLQKAQKK